MSNQRIVITGASRGLGAALAMRLAGEGRHLCLCARDTSNVESLSADLTAKGSTVEWADIDVADISQVCDWIDAVWQAGPIDTLILNAGIYDGRGEDGQLESPARAGVLLATNLTGSIAPALTVAQKMRARKDGHIVFISSLASFAAQADAPTYCASKAAVTSFARALREDLAPQNVRVTLVHPGNIDSVQTRQQIGATPGLVSAQTAADRIVKGMQRGQSEINFPRVLRLGLAVLAMLPWRLRARLNRPFRFRVRPPSQSNLD